MWRRIPASATSVGDPGVHCCCGEPAVSFLEIHAIDDCQDEPTVGAFFCGPCLESRVEIAQLIADDGSVECSICGLEIVRLCDIVVKVCHIGLPV